ncbi:MAG: NADH-quinone oxidoreductase subunit N [Verrucomicrobia bacterium]|nr:NADH-quinone oxidoreductase subunit N [Verrucomicrobiota bacterium]
MSFPPALLELLVLCLGLALLLVESFTEKQDRTLLAYIGMVGLGVIFLILQLLPPGPTGMASYVFDPVAIFFKKFVVLTTIIVLIMSVDYATTIQRFVPGISSQAGLGEFFAIPILTCAGMMWMASAIDFILIFVSLELVTISFYVLVAFMRRNASSLEAGVKYLILSAFSTGFFAYGAAWIFGVTGNTNLVRIQQVLPALGAENYSAILFGALLVLVGLGFKIAAAPFQFWVPDVYQGAPTPITAFLSVGSKAVGFIVLLRVVQAFQSLPPVGDKVVAALIILAAATLIYGNLAALPQTNLKRLLAYSSIGHAGYLLMAVAGISARDSGQAVVIYLAAYLLMTLLSFLILIIVSNYADGDEIVNFNGLSQRSPLLAFGLLVAMMSLAGVPFTAGFLGKFLVFKVAYESQQFVLLALGIITVGCGFYYYLKVVRAMYWQSAASNGATIPVSGLSFATIVLLVLFTFLLGIFPQMATGLLR